MSRISPLPLMCARVWDKPAECVTIRHASWMGREGWRAHLLSPHAKKVTVETPGRLRQLADDCDERARRSNNSDARSLYWRAARDARQGAAARHMGDDERRAVLAAMMAQAALARWYDGDGAGEAGIAQLVRPMLDSTAEPQPITRGIAATPADNRSVPPADAVNARQLAALFGVTERTARRTIERGVRKGWAGFHRDGCHLFAEREAFERARRGALSELCPNGSPAVGSANDSADHSQAA